MGRRSRLLAIVGVVGALVASTTAGAAAQEPVGLERAREAKARYANELFATSGVVGVGITAGGSASEIIVLTSRAVAGLPKKLDGVRVTAVVTGPIRAGHHRPNHDSGPPEATTTTSSSTTSTTAPSTTTTQPTTTTTLPPTTSTDPKSRFDAPVPIGISTGPAGECSAGTLGVELTTAGGDVGLSNNHVWARENAAETGAAVYQPGSYDTGCTASAVNLLGTLVAYVPLRFEGSCASGGGDNVVDAAIASPTSRAITNTTPTDGYGTVSTTVAPPAPGQAVQKYGRTSTLTTGTVLAIDVDVNVRYSTGTACFRDQIMVQGQKPFLKAGDSGSLLVTAAENRPVGLLFAADNSGKNAFANPIADVLGAFSATVSSG
ncbi:MAG TPA: hypothetical protein VFW06_02190 [Acidimicrobiia bacterium]|nr:hypothetical protein [Acidimicrobiia bacterium]